MTIITAMAIWELEPKRKEAMSFNLNKRQKEAVEALGGSLLILAGAGSGKTKVVTCRVINLISQGVPAEKILALTFTNKAAGEMRKRIEKAVNAKVRICTFHALGARILREYGHYLGLDNTFTIYDEEDRAKLLKNVLKDLRVPYRKSELKMIGNLISRTKSNFEEHCLGEGLGTDFAQIFKAYQQSMLKCQATDFDDLLYLPITLFKRFPEVLTKYRARYSHLLIDEYQDTNHAQYELVKMLAAELDSICAVGDPDQSIYSWRGADIHNILNFEKDFSDAVVIRLEQNYRSTTNILEAANSLISHNSDRYEKKLWSDLGKGREIAFKTLSDERNEARYIAREIVEYHQEDNIPLNEIAILYRTNSQSREFEESLMSHNLPYTIVGGVSFYQRREIKDILAFLRLIHSPRDLISFERAINTPSRGLGKATVEKIKELSATNNLSPIDCCKKILKTGSPLRLNTRQKRGLENFSYLTDKLRRSTSEIPEIIIEIIERTDYLKYLYEDPETCEERKNNLDALITKAREWQEDNPGLSLRAFLEEISLKADIDEAQFSDDKVTLMTLHNSKGLEFRAIFLTGLEEDLFPHINAKNDPSQIEEERRLCYVGMTRARERLCLTNAQARYLWGVKRRQRASRFLREIAPQFLDDQQRVSSALAIGDAIMHEDLGVGIIKEKFWNSHGLTYRILFANDRRLKNIVAKYTCLTKL